MKDGILIAIHITFCTCLFMAHDIYDYIACVNECIFINIVFSVLASLPCGAGPCGAGPCGASMEKSVALTFAYLPNLSMEVCEGRDGGMEGKGRGTRAALPALGKWPPWTALDHRGGHPGHPGRPTRWGTLWTLPWGNGAPPRGGGHPGPPGPPWTLGLRPGGKIMENWLGQADRPGRAGGPVRIRSPLLFPPDRTAQPPPKTAHYDKKQPMLTRTVA